MKAATPDDEAAALVESLRALPAAMQALPQWLLWRLVEIEPGKKPRKVPFYVSGRKRSGSQGDERDRAELKTFDVALAELAHGRYEGLGFAFLPGDGLIGIDIDGAISDDGVVSERCQSIIDACISYTEYSPSGKGVHIIVAGSSETFKDNSIGLEVFCGRQFFTCTGRRWPGAPADVAPIAEATLRRLKATVQTARKGKAAVPVQTFAPTPATELIAKLEDALRFISPDLPHDDWVVVGMALKQALGDTGQALWEYWSSKGAKAAGSDLIRSKWASFRGAGGRGTVTEASIFKMAMQAGWKPPRPPKAPQTRPDGDSRPEPEDEPALKPPEWPDPILPGLMRTPVIPADVLPGWLGDMAGAIAESTQTPPALAVMSCLAVLATVLQRRFEVAPFGDTYTEPLSLWTLTAAPSGARKTAVQSAALGPIVRWEKHKRDNMRVEIARANSAREVAKKRVERLLGDAAKAKTDKERELLRAEIQREEEDKPAELRAPRLFTGDTTAERLQAMLVEYGERMAVHTDEAGIFSVMAGIYTSGQANLDVFLQAHAGSPLRVDRAGRSAHIDRPALSFGLTLQPGVLSEAAGSRRFRDSGLLARFLYAMPVSNVGTRDVRRNQSIPVDVRNAYESNINRLLEGQPGEVVAPKVLVLSGAARELWFELAEAIEHAQGEGGKFESISDWTSKLPGAVARIAALFELAEAGLSADVVSERAMRMAVRLGRLLIPHAQTAFGLLGTDSVDIDAAAILKWVRAGELLEFTRRECQKAMEGRFRNVERLAKALERLDKQDIVRENKRPNKGAPPTTFYRVNPKVLST